MYRRNGDFTDDDVATATFVGVEGEERTVVVTAKDDDVVGDIIVKAIPIGGFRMVDNGEADDKIIAVLKNDDVYSQWNDVSELPASIINRLKHYFLTYKQLPGSAQQCEITHVYGREESLAVIEASRRDYQAVYGDLENVMSLTLVEMMNFGQRQQEILKAL